MKKLLLFILTFICSWFIHAQEGHKLVFDIDGSFGMQYISSSKDVNNPIALGVSLGYEHNVNLFFGVEAGFRVGGFEQSTGSESGPNINPGSTLKNTTLSEKTTNTVYKGSYWAPYIAPKLYLPIGYDEKKDRGRYIFIENRFSYTRASIDKDKISNMSGGSHKSFFQYEIRGGYQFPIAERWGMTGWIGYNTFNFSKINPDVIEFKNSTPIQLGIGFHYIIK